LKKEEQCLLGRINNNNNAVITAATTTTTCAYKKVLMSLAAKTLQKETLLYLDQCIIKYVMMSFVCRTWVDFFYCYFLSSLTGPLYQAS
jgi:hypothetical protein